jgi:predicted O-methyltransferase YrrM/glycosyltransferase involved in cell wall biosynthesis
MGPALSTIILNWNRNYLLKQCVESYLSTVGDEFELIIVDNHSTDGSIKYLHELERERPIKVIRLDENIGGEAFNCAIPLVRGDLIHLSENDQIFLPGWHSHVIASFDAFNDLGQLSLFSDTPTDDEVGPTSAELVSWEPKPSHLRFGKGKILYETHANVGTSSVIRASLFRNGLRVNNIVMGEYKFPDDGRLSADIKSMGAWCAWSDRYYVRNVGHEMNEFRENPDYYEKNYASKPWVGVSGWRARIDQQASLPRMSRRSLALPDRTALPEKTREAVNGTPARVWSMFDGFTAEVEVLDLLLTLTRLVKPSQVLETGTWLGLSSCAIARGLAANGFGRLTTLEINAEAHHVALEHIAHYGLTPFVDAKLVSSLEFIPDDIYDMALFDSELALRVPEFRRFRPSLRDGALVILHDTAPHHGTVTDGVRSLVSEGAVVGVDLPTPRGVFIGRVRPESSLKAGPAKLSLRRMFSWRTND